MGANKRSVEDESILEEAQRLVYGNRQSAYGHPLDDYTKVAALWSVIINAEVTAKQAALCMVAIKISRELHMHKRDNLVDGAGYFAVAARIEEEQLRREAVDGGSS